MMREHGRQRPPHCLLIPSFAGHYVQLERNLRSLHHHASDPVLPPLHVVLDTQSDVDAILARMVRAYGSSLRMHSLQELMREAGEDATSDPGVRALLQEARARAHSQHCSGSGGRAVHLCDSFHQSDAFHSRCQQRCLRGEQPPLALLPPLPANATPMERMHQIAMSANIVRKNKARGGSSPQRLHAHRNESACRHDCEQIATIAAEASRRHRIQLGPHTASADHFDLFSSADSKTFLENLGSPVTSPGP